MVALITAGAGAAETTSPSSVERLWVSQYDGPGIYEDHPYAIGLSPDGATVFVAGVGSAVNGHSFGTVAYNAATGTELWAADGPVGSYHEAAALGVSPDGSTVFVTGLSSDGPISEYSTIAYDAATGSVLWDSRYDGPGDNYDHANALGISPDGSIVFVTGFSIGDTTSYDFATVAYNSATGAELWVSRYGGTGSGVDEAKALGVSPDGSTVFVTGNSDGPSSDDYATLAYDAATGAELWTSRYNGTGNAGDRSRDLGVSPDGSTVFVTGISYAGFSTNDDFATVAYDSSTGSELWVSQFDGRGHGRDSPADLGVSPDGSALFVAGYSLGYNTGNDYATVAYDQSTGARLWVSSRASRGYSDYPRALGVSPDSSMVFVTGETGAYNGGTLAHDASTGTQLWAARAGGKGIDGMNALAISPDSSVVFVTGDREVRRNGQDFDYMTIAYST